jgi:hypothetical protein
MSDTNEFDSFCTPSKPLGDTSLMVVEIKRLERENAALRDALKFYGDCQTYGLNGGNMKRVLTDAGAIARHALRKEPKR